MDIYQTITDKIVGLIEAGAGKWRMPWHSREAGAIMARPHNPLSGTRYRGINVALLWAAAEAKGYTSHAWATYNQWQAAGAQVRKGERSELVFFWKRVAVAEGEDDDGEAGEDTRKYRFIARAYNVFAAEQVDGWEPVGEPAAAPEGLAETLRIGMADGFFRAVGAKIEHGGNRACYIPAADMIRMPQFADFDEPVAYYATLGHEHVHWTGAEGRCAREFGKRFGDAAYAFEELVAELGAAFLCAELGLANEPRPAHAAYIDTWLDVLRRDKRAIFTAGGKAQAAVEFLVAAAAGG